jgi:hypothetical protein
MHTEYGDCEIIDTLYQKIVKSPNYNYVFNKNNGFFCRWGKTMDDDPVFSPFGPEILDLEISTGECLGKCPYCYKRNGNSYGTHHMTFEEFVKIMRVMPPVLTQIAFGITDIYGNKDFFKMMEYAKQMGVIPNYTCHGLDVDDYAVQQTARLCGAVAVSIVDREKTYDAIKKFTDAGMDQANIHYVLSQQSVEDAACTIADIVNDPRLAKLNAIVFLQYKPKGRSVDKYDSIPDVGTYKYIIEMCEQAGVRYGFDSCSAPLFFKAVEGRDDMDQLIQLAEPCESFGMFSSYINCRGYYYPCSFSEGENFWRAGFDVLSMRDYQDFLKHIWHNNYLVKWRDRMMVAAQDCDCQHNGHCRFCPIFNITPCRREYVRNQNCTIDV